MPDDLGGFTQTDRKVLILLEDGMRRMEGDLKPALERLTRLEVEKATHRDLQDLLETVNTKLEEDDFTDYKKEHKVLHDDLTKAVSKLQLQMVGYVSLLTGAWAVLKFIFKAI